MNYDFLAASMFVSGFALGFILNLAATSKSLIFANRVLILIVLLTGMFSSALEIHPWILYGIVSGMVCSQNFVKHKD